VRMISAIVIIHRRCEYKYNSDKEITHSSNTKVVLTGRCSSHLVGVVPSVQAMRGPNHKAEDGAPQYANTHDALEL